MLRVVFASFFIMLIGCAHSSDATSALTTSSRIANARQVARSIVLCQTTEAAVRSALGEPTRDGIVHRQRIVSWIVSGQGAVKYLAIAVNASGIVTDIYWDVPTEIPWIPQASCT